MIKPIEDFDGYFISDKGTVYCNLGKGNRRHGKTVSLYPLTPRLTKTGYERVCCRQTSTNKRKDLYIHRLVATYFLPKIPGKNVVNHKDNNKSNNNIDNLEWCTQKENIEYCSKQGRMKRNPINGRFESGLINQNV